MANVRLRFRRRAPAPRSASARAIACLFERFAGAARFRRRATEAFSQAGPFRAAGHRAGFREIGESRQETRQEKARSPFAVVTRTVTLPSRVKGSCP